MMSLSKYFHWYNSNMNTVESSQTPIQLDLGNFGEM